MSKHGARLPQLDHGRFLTDGGLETTLIFREDWALPIGEAFTLLESEQGRAALTAYFDRYVPIAVADGYGFILESPTWRANPDWAARIGYGRDGLARINRDAIRLMEEIRLAYESEQCPIVISGCVGPRGDGYRPGALMGPEEMETYHAFQVGVFAEAGADLVSAITMTNVNEAIGVTRAAQAVAIPAVISFTLETDGRLPTGDALGEAIEAVDAATGRGPLYYMINCTHPCHFERTLAAGGAWLARLRGIRANASRRSHAELDEAAELDAGDPIELGAQYRELLRQFPQINVLGGCCGTDHRHIEQIATACRAAA